MAWHYIENGQQAGPVDEAAFNSLVSTGRIKPDTMIWRDGMKDWAPYASVVSPGAAVSIAGATSCSECGNVFPPEDLVQIGGRAVCATCKPIAVQKLKEGVTSTGQFRYAGFWIRFAAKFVDGLILVTVGFASGIIAGIIGGQTHSMTTATYTAQGVNILFRAAYIIWFTGRYGATPGKMACGIRVIQSDGEKVSYARATGRFFAEILNLFTLYIGYIMVAFDDEKRGLHDRICDTRVVYK